MSSSTHRIRVDVVTNFVEEQSNPGDGRFVFAYTITIRNEGKVPARLLSRHWIITDANDEVQEVRGLGVIGQQPLLQPGESFEYTSGCALATPVGTPAKSTRPATCCERWSQVECSTGLRVRTTARRSRRRFTGWSARP